jgi:hypothetical protein
MRSNRLDRCKQVLVLSPILVRPSNCQEDEAAKGREGRRGREQIQGKAKEKRTEIRAVVLKRCLSNFLVLSGAGDTSNSKLSYLALISTPEIPAAIFAAISPLPCLHNFHDLIAVLLLP